MSWRKDKGGLGPESGLGLRPKARAKARAGAVPKLSPSRAHHPDGSVARTLPARATTPTRTPSASVRTASARSTRCGRPTASLPLCAPPPVAALSAAAHTHTVPHHEAPAHAQDKRTTQDEAPGPKYSLTDGFGVQVRWPAATPHAMPQPSPPAAAAPTQLPLTHRRRPPTSTPPAGRIELPQPTVGQV